MTLYRHRRTGEQIRTVTNSYEDNRLGLADDWQTIPDGTDEPAPDAREHGHESPDSRVRAGRSRGAA